jgi:hypothetical protein
MPASIRAGTAAITSRAIGPGWSPKAWISTSDLRTCCMAQRSSSSFSISAGRTSL